MCEHGLGAQLLPVRHKHIIIICRQDAWHGAGAQDHDDIEYFHTFDHSVYILCRAELITCINYIIKCFRTKREIV